MEEKVFKSELFGLSKKEVERYINQTRNEYEEKIQKISLEKQEIEKKANELIAREEEINEKTVLVSNALIKAEEQAKQIVTSARERAQAERAQLDVEIEKEREKLIDAKRNIEELKENVRNILSKFIDDLEKVEAITGQDTINQNISNTQNDEQNN